MDHEGEYTCTASNGVDNNVGFINSSSANLTVQVPPDLVPLQNETVLGLNGESVVLRFEIVNASPPVTPDHIRWFFQPLNDTLLKVEIVDDGVTYMFTSDRLNLIVMNVSNEVEGTYTIEVQNEAGMDNERVILFIEGI